MKKRLRIILTTVLCRSFRFRQCCAAVRKSRMELCTVGELFNQSDIPKTDDRIIGDKHGGFLA